MGASQAAIQAEFPLEVIYLAIDKHINHEVREEGEDRILNQ